MPLEYLPLELNLEKLDGNNLMRTREKPPITVVIPVLEICDELFFSLRSICQTHYSNFQVVLILSNKCKSKLHFLREYLTLPFISYAFELEPGLYQAMNQGWRASRDSLICFLGVGDFFISPDSFKLVASFFDGKNINSEHGGYGPWFFMNSKNCIKFAAIDQNFHTSDLLSTATPICHQTVFMTKHLLSKLGGFNTDYLVAADRDLINRAALICSPLVWSEPTVGYVEGGFSAINENQGHFELEVLRNSQPPKQDYFPAIHSMNRTARFWRNRKLISGRPYSWISSDIIDFCETY